MRKINANESKLINGGLTLTLLWKKKVCSYPTTC